MYLTLSAYSDRESTKYLSLKNYKVTELQPNIVLNQTYDIGILEIGYQ